MGEPAALFEVEETVGVFTLNRPRAHNCVDEPMLREWESLARALDGEHAGLAAVLVTHEGEETFCSGGDLAWFASMPTREEGAAVSRRMTAVLDRLWRGPQLVVAAWNGRALGGGAEILTACHLRLATARSSVAFVQARNGITTGWGGGVRLFRLLGRARALRLLLTAERLDAEEALAVGLVDSILDENGWRDEAVERVRGVAALPAGAREGFLSLAAAAAGDEAFARAKEAEIFAERWVSPEFRERVASFLRRAGGD